MGDGRRGWRLCIPGRINWCLWRSGCYLCWYHCCSRRRGRLGRIFGFLTCFFCGLSCADFSSWSTVRTMIFTVLDTSPDSRPAAVGDGPAPAFLPFSAPDPLLGDPELPISLRGTSGTRDGEMAATAALTSVCSVGSAAHTYGQQHRASTNRAHSRRHVVIIVSVVVQRCGADLHSEGHGEQQGRREVQQTHTEGTPRTTHRWKRKKQTGAAHKAPPHAHTARAVRCVCTPHGGCAHTRGGAAHTATQKQSNNEKKKIPAHHVNCWSTGIAANIHHKAACYVVFAVCCYNNE
ncbi:hypothetical protein TCSYLVIO_005275 [Trypanosoma cruzi]|nr:hypothetical protein TCSYLVIO_005275 [Trypanosoma cruzi]